MRRTIASLLVLAFLVGVTVTPASASFFGLIPDPSDVAKLIYLGKILKEVKRLQAVANQTRQQYLELRAQAQRYSHIDELVVSYLGASPLSIVTGQHCTQTIWNPLFNEPTGIAYIDQAFRTVRQTRVGDCTEVGRLPARLRALNELMGSHETASANAINTAADTAFQAKSLTRVKIEELLTAITAPTDPDNPIEGATTEAQKLATAAAMLTVMISATTSNQVERNTLTALRAQRSRDIIVASVNAEVNRHRTHTGNFAAIEER